MMNADPTAMQKLLEMMINLSIVFYVVAFAISLIHLVSRVKNVSVWNRLIFSVGWILHTMAFLLRWIETYRQGFGHVPVTNRYESLIFFGWCLALGWIVTQFRSRNPGLAAGMQFSAAAMTASTGLLAQGADRITPLMPALKSNWLLFHVVTCFLAYSAFAVATFAAFKMLRNKPVDENKNTSDMIPELFMYRCISVGFFLLTLGILSGSAWAQRSWGRYWGWDPKETWSLITWIIYAIFLHARMTRGWKGKRLALLAIVGFLAVLFTFLGVNYLPVLQGLHSYA